MSGFAIQAGMMRTSVSGGSGPGPRVGFNFRQTIEYVTDGPGDTWVDGTKTYADIGENYGWVTLGVARRNRNSALDPKIAGCQSSNSSTEFRYDLPSPGTYKIIAGFTDQGSRSPAYWDLCDGGMAFHSIRRHAIDYGLPPRIFDANGDVNERDAWVSSDGGTPFVHTFTNSYFILRSIPPGAGSNTVSHLSFQQL